MHGSIYVRHLCRELMAITFVTQSAYIRLQMIRDFLHFIMFVPHLSSISNMLFFIMCRKNVQHKYVIWIPLDCLLWHCVLVQLDRFSTTDPVVWSLNVLLLQIDYWNVSRTNLQISYNIFILYTC